MLIRMSQMFPSKTVGHLECVDPYIELCIGKVSYKLSRVRVLVASLIIAFPVTDIPSACQYFRRLNSALVFHALATDTIGVGSSYLFDQLEHYWRAANFPTLPLQTNI